MSNKSTLAIACTIDSKTATLTGAIARNEQVDVTISDYGNTLAADMNLAIVRRGVTIATLSTFELSGSDLIGVLDLDTEGMDAAMIGSTDGGHREFNLILWDADAERLLVNTPINIYSNPVADVTWT